MDLLGVASFELRDARRAIPRTVRRAVQFVVLVRPSRGMRISSCCGLRDAHHAFVVPFLLHVVRAVCAPLML